MKAACVMGVTLIALALLPSTTSAQLPDPPSAPSEAAMERGRRLFIEGTRAAERSRWRDALRAFLESYRVTGSPVALFNVATTLRALGRVRQARDAFDRLLSMELSERARVQAENLRTEVATQVALLRLRGVPAAPRLLLRLDGEPRSVSSARPVELELDPGRHALDLSVDGGGSFRWRGSLTPGRVLTLTVDMSGAGADDGGEGDLLEEPWLWVAIGGGAALLVGIITAIAVDASQQLSPRTPFVVELP